MLLRTPSSLMSSRESNNADKQEYARIENSARVKKDETYYNFH
jgi:hypothetical protein